MRSVFKPLVLLLAVPVVVSALAAYGRTQWEGRWTVLLARQLVAQGQRPTAPFMRRFSLSVLCSDPRAGRQIGPCRPYNLASQASAGSAIVAGVGLMVLGLAGGAGWLVRLSSRLRARAFRPALIAVSGCAVVLALAHAVLAVVGFSLAGQVVGWWPTSLTLAAALGALVWVIGVGSVAVGVNRTSSVSVVGRSLDLAAQPRLAPLLLHLADRVGVKPPDRVVAGLTPGEFLTSAPFSCLDGTFHGRTLYVSLAMCRILTEREFSTLVAHELRHFDGGGARGALPFERGALTAIETFRGRAHGMAALVILPALVPIAFVTDQFRADVQDMASSELSADRAAAALEGAAVYGAALVKAHAFAPAWQTVLLGMTTAVDTGSQYANASEVFAETVRADREPSRLAGLGALCAPHPFDTHPPLSVRLAAIGTSVEQVAGAALQTNPADSAIGLFEGVGNLERDLSVAEHHLTALVDRQDSSNTPRAQAMASG